MSLLAASGVAVGGRGVLIQGPPGSGKSSLALALIDRGAVLIGDDGVELATREGRLWASPPPNIAGLIEVRNVGLVTLATTSAPIALVVALSPEAPRQIERADRMTLLGCELPLVRLWPDSPVLALRAEQALKLHGLR
jgi:serine kinase of HPr protein (carbohydrate metabolism regulator)